MDEEMLEEESTEEEGDPVDPGDASDSPPADEADVPDVDDDGERPDVDWDVEPAEEEASEQQVFDSQPVPPYNLGDIWNASASLRRICTTARSELESFHDEDWVDYTEEEPPTPEALVTVTHSTDEVIDDFSAARLAKYEANGAVPIAVLDDGTERECLWSEVFDPRPPEQSESVVFEADAIAKATNQHFWHRATDPDNDGAGMGAFVTDSPQDAFLASAADGFPDYGEPTETEYVEETLAGDGETVEFALSRTATSAVVDVAVDGIALLQDADYTCTTESVTLFNPPRDGAEILLGYTVRKRKWHNLLMNAEGILLRAAAYVRASFSPSGVMFFDGLGNGVGNIVARFGKNLARIGYQSDEHIDIESGRVTIFNGLKRRALFGRQADKDVEVLGLYGYDTDGSDRYSALYGADTLGIYDLKQSAFLMASPWYIDCKGTNGSVRLSTQASQNPMTISNSAPSVVYSIDQNGSVHLAKSQGVYTKDATEFEYPMIHDNGSNIWIGAAATAAQHHKGGTYISSGHDGSAGKPTIYVSVPNAANNNATNYGVYHTGNKPNLTALPGTLGINNGGTGSAGISITTGASLVTSGDATVTACSLSKWGPLACLSVTFTPKSSWANGAQLYVGKVAAQANMPSTQVGGGAAGITAGCSTVGSIYARNHTGAARTASTTLSFVYLCDI